MNNAAGILCFKRAILALRLQPLTLVGTSVFAALLTITFSGIPLAGTVLASLWMPFGAVLTGIATRDALAGRSPSYAPLLSAVKDHRDRKELLTAGIVYTILTELLTFVFTWLAREDIANWKLTEDGLGLDTASIAGNIPWEAILVTGALYVPVLMMTAFSPLLIVLGRQSAGKSFFYSFFSTLRNFGTVLLAVLVFVVLFGGSFALLEVALLSVGLEGFFLFVSPLLMAVILTVANALVWTLYEAVLSPEPQKDAERRSR